MRHALRIVASVVAVAALTALPAEARRGHEWYDHYEQAREALDAADHEAALRALDRALALRPEAGRLRTYGNTFIVYLPEAVRALALFGLGRDEEALEWAGRAERTGLLGREPALGARLADAAEAARLRAEREEARRREAEALSRASVEDDPAPGRPEPSVPAGPTEVAGAAPDPEPPVTPAAEVPPSRETIELARTEDDLPPDPAPRQTVPTPRAGTPPKPAVSAPAADPRRAEAEILMREGMRDFLAGELVAAERRLAGAAAALPARAGPRAVLGALRYTRYLLEGENDPDAERLARTDFRQALRLDPDLELDEGLFSPRVRAFMEQQRPARR